MTGPTPSPESPAVQDTDRLREVADSLVTPETIGAFYDEYHYAGIDVAAGLTGWPRETAQIRAGLIAALAAFLPVHREMVGREIFNALSEEIAWQREKYGDGTDRSATGRLIGMEDAATTVRRLAVPAPPTPPGSPPADERATAVETGRAVKAAAELIELAARAERAIAALGDIPSPTAPEAAE